LIMNEPPEVLCTELILGAFTYVLVEALVA
jgi:hypothetical protein